MPPYRHQAPGFAKNILIPVIYRTIYKFNVVTLVMIKTEPEAFSLLINDCLEIRQSEPVNIVSVRWLRHPSSTEFRENNYLLADLLLESECPRLLNDARAVHYLELADQHWLMEQMIPLLYATSLEMNACVVSQLSMELMDTNRLVKHFSCYPSPPERVIETRLFLDVLPAREWLL